MVRHFFVVSFMSFMVLNFLHSARTPAQDLKFGGSTGGDPSNFGG